MYGGIGADDVIVGQQVAESELLRPQRVGPYGADVGPDLGLRKYNANVHGNPLRSSLR
jgi:hypothetical protein